MHWKLWNPIIFLYLIHLLSVVADLLKDEKATDYLLIERYSN